LLILSSCESAMAATAIPDETYGLAGLFYGISATAVIAAQWRVEQFATAALFDAFYEQWRGSHRLREIAEAFCGGRRSPFATAEDRTALVGRLHSDRMKRSAQNVGRSPFAIFAMSIRRRWDGRDLGSETTQGTRWLAGCASERFSARCWGKKWGKVPHGFQTIPT
jgi:hypothetical protein